MKLLLCCIIHCCIIGCSIGPIKITHKDGNLPKAQIDMPTENVHLKIRRLDEINLVWEIEF